MINHIWFGVKASAGAFVVILQPQRHTVFYLVHSLSATIDESFKTRPTISMLTRGGYMFTEQANCFLLL